jgi:hypothetical protein
MSDVEPSLSSDATAGCGAQDDRPLVSRLTKSYGGEALGRPSGARGPVYTENSDSGVLMVQSARDQVRYDVSRAMNRA